MVRALYVNVVNAELEGHSSKAWRFVGSPLAHQQIRFCAPFAWIDDED